MEMTDDASLRDYDGGLDDIGERSIVSSLSTEPAVANDTENASIV